MTKPIEGWVTIFGGEPAVYCDGQDKHGRPYGQRVEVLIDHPGLSMAVRPVQITFTDEPNDEIADAVREERDAIWDRIRGGNWSCAAIKKAIFGEEK